MSPEELAELSRRDLENIKASFLNIIILIAVILVIGAPIALLAADH